MANTGFKGINIKQTGVPIDFAQVILDSSSNAVTTGSPTLEIHEIQSDGTIKVFEWNATGQYTFKATGSVLTASSAVFVHQKNGLWTYVLSSANAANFTVGAKYFWYINHASGSPNQICREFQYGSNEGDLSVTASGTSGLGYNTSDVVYWKGSTAAAMTGDAYAYLTTNLGALGANASGLANAVWSATTRTLSAFSFTVNTNANATETAINTAVNSIPTNPLLTTDTRLNNLDATVSSRLPTSGYTSPPSAVTIQTGLATSAALATVSTNVSAIPTNPLLTTDTRLNNLDATVSSRLATSGYTTPPTAGTIQSGLATSAALSTVATNVTAIKAKTDNLPASPAAVGSQMDLVNAPNATAISAITSGIGSGLASQIWQDTTAGDFTVANSAGSYLKSAGGGSVTVNANITVPSIVAAASQIPNQLTCVIGDTLTRQFTIGTITGWSKIIITAKKKITDSDSLALFQVEAISTGGAGLLVIAGATASDATQGSITVNDATLGTITLTLSKSATGMLPEKSGHYSIRVLNGTNSNSPIYNQPFSANLSTNALIS